MKQLPLFLVLLLFLMGNGKTSPIDTDEVVLKNAALIMGIRKEKLKTKLPFANQEIPGDALDVVEIVMAVEEELNIEISDKELDAMIGPGAVADIAAKLTIQQLQEIVKKIYQNKIWSNKRLWRQPPK